MLGETLPGMDRRTCKQLAPHSENWCLQSLVSFFKKKKVCFHCFSMNCWQNSYSIVHNGQWGMCVGKGRGEGVLHINLLM